MLRAIYPQVKKSWSQPCIQRLERHLYRSTRHTYSGLHSILIVIYTHRYGRRYKKVGQKGRKEFKIYTNILFILLGLRKSDSAPPRGEAWEPV